MTARKRVVSNGFFSTPGLTPILCLLPWDRIATRFPSERWGWFNCSPTKIAKVMIALGMVILALPAWSANVIYWSQFSVTTTEGSYVVEVPLSREGDLTQRASVRFSTIPGSALPDVDYLGTVGSFTFPEGVGLGYVRIPLVNDGWIELSKSFRVHLSEFSSGWNLQGAADTTVRIMDDDTGFRFGYEDASQPYEVHVSESGEALAYVVRGTDWPGEVWVDYDVVGLTAVLGEDFDGSSGRLVFAEGEYTKPIRVRILSDQKREDTEIFSIRLRAAMPGTRLGAVTTAKIYLEDDDPGPSLTSSSVGGPAQESDGGIHVRVSRGQYPPEGVLEVGYRTIEETAKEGDDFLPMSGRLVFGPGEVFKEVEIPLINDALSEETEHFGFQLFHVEGGVELNVEPSYSIEIFDDDRGFWFEKWTEPSSEAEPGELVFRVHRSDDRAERQEVSYRTREQTARAGREFIPVSGRLVFLPGQLFQTITVRTLDNDELSPGRYTAFSLELFDPSNGVIAAGESELTVTILDDESEGKVVIDAKEGTGLGTVTVFRDNAFLGAATVKVEIQSGIGQAENQTDLGFRRSSGVISFLPGQREARFDFEVFDDEVIALFQRPQPVARVTQVSGALIRELPEFTFGTIEEDDRGFYLNPPSPLGYVIEENSGIVRLEVRRHGFGLRPASIQYRVLPGEYSYPAQPGVDYRTNSGTLHFAQGESSKAFELVVLDNSRVQSYSELSLRIELSNPIGDTPLDRAAGFGDANSVFYPLYLRDDERNAPGEQLELITPLMWPGIVGSVRGIMEKEGEVELALQRSESLKTEKVFDLEISNAPECDGCFGELEVQAATPGRDFEPARFRIRFAPGESVVKFPVRVHADQEAEGFERMGIWVSEHLAAGDGKRTFFPFLIHDATRLPPSIVPLTQGEVDAAMLERSERSFPDGGGLAVVRNGPLSISREVVRFRPDGSADPEFHGPSFSGLNFTPFNIPPFRDAILGISAEHFYLLSFLGNSEGIHRLQRFHWNGLSDLALDPWDLLMGVPSHYDTHLNRFVLSPTRLIPVSSSEFLLLGRSVINGRLTPYGARIDTDGQPLDVFPQDARVAEDSGSRELHLLRYGNLSEAISYRWQFVDGTAHAGVDFSKAEGVLAFPPGESSASIPLTLIDNRAPEPDKSFAIRFTPLAQAPPCPEIPITIENDEPGILDISVVEPDRTFVRLLLTGRLTSGSPSAFARLIASEDGRHWEDQTSRVDTEAGTHRHQAMLRIRGQTQYFRLETPGTLGQKME